MKMGKKRYSKKDVYKSASIALTLVILVLLLGYIIFTADFLKPKINETSARYISLKNPDTTDMLKVTNLKKLIDSKGINHNRSYKKFQVTGEKESTYQIVLYHLGDKVNEEYIKFYLENEHKDILQGILNNQKETNDGGKIIYEGKIQEGKNWNLKMWVDKEYQKNVNNISYEIRIKTS